MGRIKSKQIASVDADKVVETPDKRFVTEEEVEIINKPSSYSFSQVVPSATWIINHPLEKFPTVTVTDSAGSVVGGDVEYTDNANLIIRFAASFAGEAHLN